MEEAWLIERRCPPSSVRHFKRQHHKPHSLLSCMNASLFTPVLKLKRVIYESRRHLSHDIFEVFWCDNECISFFFLSNPAVLLSRGSVKHIQGDWVISTQPILRKWCQRHHRILLKQLHHRICCLLWLAALNSLFVGHSGFFLSYKPAICQQAPHSTDQSLALSLTELCHRHGQQHVDFFFCRKMTKTGKNKL